MPELGVTDLARDLRELQQRYDLDSIRAGVRVQGGHTIFVSMARGAPLVLEREDGHSIIAPASVSS